MSIRRRVVSSLSVASFVAAAAVTGPPPVRAQSFSGAMAPLQADDTLSAKESNSGVYVRDSAVALEKMALAEKMEHLHEWTKSADVYQEIMDKYRDRVVPSHTDRDGVIDQYTSVISRVTDHLRAWPNDGLNVYRARYEVTAQGLLKTARRGDLRPLHEALTRYFVTETGKQAGLKLIDAYFELGEFPAAAWIGQQLLLHPNLVAERPKVLFRVGLAEHLAGDERAARSALAELKNKFPQAVGAVRGTDVVLADELAADVAGVKAENYAAAGDSWLMPGGDASRSKVSSAAARPGARLYAVPLAQPNWKAVQDVNQRKQLQSQDDAARSAGGALGVLPAVDGDELYFQDNAHVYGVSLDSGVPLAGWAAAYPAHDGQYTLANAWNMPSSHQYSVTLTDSAVLAVMNQPDPLASMNGVAPDRDTRLVCLDRVTGRERWVAAARDLPDNALKALAFGGSPLVVGDNAYVAGRGAKGNGVEDCYVLCFDLTSGAYRWSCYVASAVSATAMMNANGQLVPGDASTHLSYASGRLFVSTNVGAVAALDAYNGTIAWLDIYRESDEAVNPNMMNMGFNPMMVNGPGGANAQGSAGAAPWAQNAPVVQGGNVFVLPSDGKYILIYDAGTGRLVKRLRKDECCKRTSDEGPGAVGDPTAFKPTTLLGVLPGAMVKELGVAREADLLVVNTPSRVCAIKWREYDENRPKASIAWVNELVNDDVRGSSIRGRGFLTTKSVYVPTAWALDRIDLLTGRIMEQYPAGLSSTWADGEGPGNVLVSGDHLIVAGDQRVTVYTDLAVAQAKLEKEEAADPADPAPRLRYAEVMFVANQPELAVKKLDEALNLLGGASSLRPGAARDRAFNDALTFAAKLQSSQGAGRAMADGLFDRAAAAALSAGQQVRYRMSRARFARDSQDFVTAVKLYQEVLADDAMRTVPVPEDSGSAGPTEGDSAASSGDAGVTQAALAAEALIRSIIAGPRGREAYEPYERQAGAKMAAAVERGDPAALMSVATVYPNARVASASMMAAAEAFEGKGQPRQATQVLRQIYLKLPEGPAKEKSAVLEAMARNYLKMPDRLEAASSRLAQAAQAAPDEKLARPLTLPDGVVLENLTLAQARDAVRRYGHQVAAANLPDFQLPPVAMRKAYAAKYHKSPDPLSPEDASTVIANVGKLLVPPTDQARNDRLATWSDAGGLAVYPVGATKPVGADADFVDEPRGAAWVDGGRDLLAWTSARLAKVGGDDVKTRWKLDVSTLPTLDVMAQARPDPQPAPDPLANLDPLVRQRIQRARMMGRANFRGNLRMAGGMAVAAAQPIAPAPAAPVDAPVAFETFVDVRPLASLAMVWTSTGRVAAVDLSSGAVVWQTRVAAHAVDRLLANDDFTVVKVTGDSTVQIVVLDTYSGRLLARGAFATEAGQYPINLALADDGTLVYSLPDRLAFFDLYEVGHDRKLDAPKVQTTPVSDPSQPAQQLFAGMTRPDQLILKGGQVLAVCDGGKFFRGYFAETGQPRETKQYIDNEPQIVPMILTTGGAGTDVGLRVEGDYVFVSDPRSVGGYNLDHPDVCWMHTIEAAQGTAQETFVGKDFVVVMNEPPGASAAPGTTDVPTPDVTPPTPAPPVNIPENGPPTEIRQPDHGPPPMPAVDAGNAPSCWMWAFSRALLPGKPVPTESGIWVYKRELVEPHGVLAWQPVDGGFCYLAGDHRLHQLKGNRSAMETAAPATSPAQ